MPLSLAVGLAMVTSYLLSSTLVPVLGVWLMKKRSHQSSHLSTDEALAGAPLATAYGKLVGGVVRLRWLIVPAYLAGAVLLIFSVAQLLPVEIFPTVDVGRFQIRLKAPTGTRIERTEQFAQQTLAAINELAGEDAVDISVGYVGLIPSSYPINAIHQWTGGPEEALIRIALEGR